MCLLIVKPAGVTFTNVQLADMYQRNKDGFGVMYSEKGVLYTEKNIGTCKEWIDFFRSHEQREACFHLRMQTHGDIDLENAHPYPVYNFEGLPKADIPIAMMHNGILSTGNAADKSKSDTWHYIRDYIHVLTKKNPEIIFTDAFREIIEKHIGGSNKFAFMDNTGRVQVINRDAGIEWHGTWFSNTYAWSAHNNDIYPGISKRKTYGGYTGYQSGRGWENSYDDDVFYPRTSKHGGSTAHNPAKHTPMGTTAPAAAPINKHTVTATPVPALMKPAETPSADAVRVPKGTDLPGKSSLGKVKDKPNTEGLNKDGKSVLVDEHGNSMTVGKKLDTVPAPSTWIPPGAAEPKKPLHNYDGVSDLLYDDVEYAMGLLDENLAFAHDIEPIMIDSMLRRWGPTGVSIMFEDALFSESADAPSQGDLIDMIKDPAEAQAYFSKMAADAGLTEEQLNLAVDRMKEKDGIPTDGPEFDDAKAEAEAAAIINEMRKEEEKEDAKLAEEAKSGAQVEPEAAKETPVMH